MRKVVVTGASGMVGLSLATRLVAAGASVVGIDRRLTASWGSIVKREGLATAEFVQGDLAELELKSIFEGADAVVHAAWDAGIDGGVLGAPQENLLVTGAVAEAAGVLGISHLVFMSCAVVYGAWAENPVPLRETASMHPNRSYSFATQKADAETLIESMRQLHPQTGVTVLRPTVIVAGSTDSPIARVLGGHRVLREIGADHQVQFVHIDDVVSALQHVLENKLTGVFNVAPNGWIFDHEARELVGTSNELRVPRSISRVARALRFRMGRSEDAPTIDPYVEHPWVVANDALRATGWEPHYSNEEALVSWQPLTWWGRQSVGRRRAYVASSIGTGIAATGVGIFAGVRLALRKRR